MTNNLKYNPVITRMLNQFSQSKDWEGMKHYFSELTHSQFRTGCNILSEQILPDYSSQTFWELFFIFTTWQPKAFLVTFLKPAVIKYKNGQLNLDDHHLIKYGKWVATEKRDIDERKFLSVFLQITDSIEEIELLFRIFEIEDLDKKVLYLLQTNTDAGYYHLFHCFKRMDDDFIKLSRYCNQLMQKKDDTSFNLVSILKCYFDLPLVKGNFSLQLNSYELSRIDASYADFKAYLHRL